MGTKRYIIKNQRTPSGFTIVELLIVVVVIAILAAITIVAYNGVTKRAAESAMQAGIKQVGTSIGVYKLDNSVYPSSLATLGIDQSLYSNKDALWAYTTTGDTFCLSTGSKTSSAIFHISDSNGAPTTGLCGDHTVGMLSSPTSPPTTTPPVASYPTRDGYTNTSTSAVGNDTEFLIGSIPTGSWMMIVYSTNNASATPAVPSGWTTLLPKYTTNSMYTLIIGKIKQAGDANQQIITSGGTSYEAYSNSVLLWGSGSDAVSSWIVGAPGNRASNATSTTTVTPTITTTVAKSLVLSIALERTSATETNYTSLTGATPWIWIPQLTSTGNTNRQQTIAIGYEEKDTPGVSPVMTVTYPNVQATNGMGIKVAIPPSS